MSLTIRIEIKCNNCPATWDQTIRPEQTWRAFEDVDGILEIWQGMGWLLRDGRHFCPSHARLQSEELA